VMLINGVEEESSHALSGSGGSTTDATSVEAFTYTVPRRHDDCCSLPCQDHLHKVYERCKADFLSEVARGDTLTTYCKSPTREHQSPFFIMLNWTSRPDSPSPDSRIIRVSCISATGR
jgi:hypothetical protein